MKTTECRSCSARIVWATTQQGKSIPMDAEPCDEGNMALVDEGGELFAITRKLAVGQTLFYKSHFATCKHAKKVSGEEKFCGHHRWIHDRADVAEKSPEVAEKSPPQECSICRGTHGLEVIHACE